MQKKIAEVLEAIRAYSGWLLVIALCLTFIFLPIWVSVLVAVIAVRYWTALAPEDRADRQENFLLVLDLLRAYGGQLLNAFKPSTPQPHNFGTLAARVICKHCKAKGSVYKRDVFETSTTTHYKHTGFMSSKRTGYSSRSRRRTECHCKNCGTSWRFD